jgi:hypothetical protein
MSSKPALIATVIVAFLAIVVLIFTIFLLDSDDSGIGNPADRSNAGGTLAHTNPADFTPFVPDEMLEAEINSAAQRLVRDNFEIFKLFYIIPYDWDVHFEAEPYGNPTEDGFYTLKFDVIDFDTVDEIFALVDSTFIETAAEIIKNDSALTDLSGPVYKDRGGRIGVNEFFNPMTYNLIWGDALIDLNFISETESAVRVIMTDEHDFEVVKQMRMLKGQDGVWRLENIFY